MKKCNLCQMAIFFVLLLISTVCRKSNKSNPLRPIFNEFKNITAEFTKGINDFEISLKSYKIPDDCKSSKVEQCELKVTKYNELKSNLVKAKEKIENFRSFYHEVIKEWKAVFYYFKNKKLEFRERNKHRKKIGYNLINKLINVFMDSRQVKQTISMFIKLLQNKYSEKQTNQTNTSFLERKIKTVHKQFSIMRIWSSFRIEEIIDTEKITGENVAKTCISNFLSSMQPTFCLKHGIPPEDVLGECPQNHTKFAGICVKNCDEDYIFSGAMCTKKCKNDQIDCGAFCGSKSCKIYDDLIAKDSYLPDYKTSKEKDVSCKKKYSKNSLLCIRNCDFYGLEVCDLATCASTKEFCNSKLPETITNFQQYFVNYLGYIFSLKSNTTLSYSDPSSFEATVDELVNYSNRNYERIRQTSKNMQKILNDPDIFNSFLNDIRWVLKHKFITYSDREIYKLVNICQTVAKEWLKMADEKGEPFDFNTLRTPFEMIDWKICEKFDVKSKQRCVKQIVSFVKRIGANDLPGITAEFLYPNCRSYR